MPRSYSHLNLQERALIETQLTLGMRPAAIAAGLMRARSTITREMLATAGCPRQSWPGEAEPGLPEAIDAFQLTGERGRWPASPVSCANWSLTTLSGSSWSIISARD